MAIAIIGVLVFAGCTGNGEDGNKIITIGNAPYDYEIPPLEVTKLIAKEQGYSIKVVEGDIGFMFLSLTNGDIDAWPGIWLPSIHRSYQERYEDQYELGSAIFEDAPIGWVVPDYVDIDSIADLKGREDVVQKKLVGFEPGSGMMLVSDEIIKGYGLDLQLVSGTLPSMLAEADYAISQKEPILFLGWRPHTMFRKYNLKVLDDPLGFWEVDSAYWGIGKDFKEKAPDMYKFMHEFKMSIEDHEAFLNSMESEGKDAAELAKQWIEDHRSEIDSWLEGAK